VQEDHDLAHGAPLDPALDDLAGLLRPAMLGTLRSRPGSVSMTSNTASPKAAISLRRRSDQCR
jgi:hypothetical protein